MYDLAVFELLLPVAGSKLSVRLSESTHVPSTHFIAKELRGETHLEELASKNNLTGEKEKYAFRHLFLMTGASPTEWLRHCVALDDRGFVLTGADLTQKHLLSAKWPLNRKPYLLETSIPAVFAVGDVRSGSIKRVAWE